MPAAHRFPDTDFDQERGWQAGEADDDEGGSPVEMSGDPAAEEDAQSGTDRDAEREQGQSPGALLLRVEIGNQSVRRGDPARFADADAHPGEEQVPEVLRQAAGRGEGAPKSDRNGDDVDPALAVGEPCDRDGQAAVEQSEGDPAHQAQLRIAELEFRLDRHRQDADDLAVDEVEDVSEEQDRQHPSTGRRFAPAPRHIHMLRTSLRR